MDEKEFKKWKITESEHFIIARPKIYRVCKLEVFLEIMLEQGNYLIAIDTMDALIFAKNFSYLKVKL